MDETGAHRRRTGRSWLGFAAWSLLVVIYAVVVFSWLWHYDMRPRGGWYDQLAYRTFLVRVLGVHVGLVGLAVIVIAALMKRWRYALASLPVVVFLLWPIHGGWIGSGDTLPSAADGELTILSVNLRRGVETDHDGVLRQISRVDPDILVLQEYTERWNDVLGPALDRQFVHRFASVRTDPQGIATFTNLDVDNERSVQLGRWEYPALRSTLRLDDGSALDLYNVHLAMPLSSSAAGHVEQRRQVARLSELIRHSSRATIVMGDLNVTETTQHFDVLLDAGLHSAWDDLHGGRGVTWKRLGRVEGLAPGLRLDHLLGTTDIRFSGIARGSRGSSDHWPLVATFSISHR